jgi:hypothetical protein
MVWWVRKKTQVQCMGGPPWHDRMKNRDEQVQSEKEL